MKVKYNSSGHLHWNFPFGTRRIREDEREPGHFLFQSLMGWHDCSRDEDEEISKG